MKNRAEKIYIFTKNISLKFDFKVLIIKFSYLHNIQKYIFFWHFKFAFNHLKLLFNYKW